MLGRQKVRALRRPHTLEVANDLKQLNVEVIRNENHDSSVDQSPQKRKNGKGKWWQWKDRKTGNFVAAWSRDRYGLGTGHHILAVCRRPSPVFFILGIFVRIAESDPFFTLP